MGLVVFVDQNSSECGLSLVGSKLAGRRLDVVYLREVSCFIRRLCVFYRGLGLNVAGCPVFGWRVVGENVGVDLFSCSCLSQDTLFMQWMYEERLLKEYTSDRELIPNFVTSKVDGCKTERADARLRRAAQMHD